MFNLFTTTTILLSSLQIARVGATVYPRTESYTGTSFFDGFEFPVETYDNTTNGDVFWATPSNTSLLYVNDANRVILKVDNTTSVVYNEKRYAPKLLTKNTYEPGTVWVMDAVHMPYGCSVWPALWTQGPNWPAGGEIDIIEGINDRTFSMMALHTGNASTCTVSNSSSSMTGTVTVDNCNNDATQNSGCTINDNSPNSYGEGFASAGGGVYVAEFATDAIRIWFMTRSSVPSSLSVSADSIDTTTLGTPVAEYSSSTCDIQNLFGPQRLTIDITLCGDFAGVPSLLAQTCPALVGDATCYSTYVVNDASATYANAYFELNYINVFSTNSSSSNATSPNGAASATTTLSAGVSGSSGSARPSTSASSAGRASTFGAGMIGLFGVLGLSTSL
ncbi:hypothetical protein IAR55_005509 [Kwoniella newhampshirensis]|uniref:GH16 domain-containing protein n=1 Tax=Kwoniella newhampshirensis TaxID=1651941 RepID=A0AAW0YHP6_9TREE